MTDLTEFLQKKMQMTDVYQPVIIRELLLHNGRRTKAQLAEAIAEHDLAARDYYEKIVMRWPKITLTKHHIVEYLRDQGVFRLIADPGDAKSRRAAIRFCDEKIVEQLEKKTPLGGSSAHSESIRYKVLKAAHGKCQLCGMSGEINPIDIDHIIPQSKAKNGKVTLGGRRIGVHDIENLQALCFKCNRAKRDKDETDFRRRRKLVRDRIPEIIEESGRIPVVKVLTGKALLSALLDKLSEEHGELLAAKNSSECLEELADISEVVIALSSFYGASERQLSTLVVRKRKSKGGFANGIFLEGISGV